jgi:phosphatidylglycerol---prolipoprotein diacylglyceryl transferase
MHPVLFQLHLPLVGSFTVSSFGAMMVGAFFAGHDVIRRELRRLGRDETFAGQILIGAALGGIVGAKLYYLLLNWPETLADPLGMLFARAGLVWYGGFIGGATGVAYTLSRHGEPLGITADACAPALALAYGIGRIGCFLVGDDYGLPTTSWIGVAFPEGAPATTAGNLRHLFRVAVPAAIPDQAVVRVYPTELFETGMALLIFWYLWRQRRHVHGSGWLFGLWMILAGVERLAIEMFRAKDDRWFGPFTTAQLISVGLIGVGFVVVRRRRAVAPVRTAVSADAGLAVGSRAK